MTRRGYTVVEVLLALAILSVFVVPLVSLSANNRRESLQADTLLTLWTVTGSQLSTGNSMTNPPVDGRFADITGGRDDLTGKLYLHLVAESRQRDGDLVVESLVSDPWAGVAPAVGAYVKEGR